MFGFSAEAVATTVRRALQRATTWADYEWEIVRPGPLSPHMHLALDQVLAEEVGDGRRRPTIRFWDWASRAVIIGSFQSVQNEVDPENAEKYGFPVARRISGGGAMFIEPAGAVTYSIYAPADLVQGMSFADSYAFFDEFAVQSLRDLGIDASYVPLNDIASPQGKIGGAAQKRLANGGVLHHATLSYDMDGQVMTEVLRIGREKLSDKGTVSAAKRVDPLRRQTGLPREAIIERFIDTFAKLYGAVPGTISDEEYAEAEALVASKFATEPWLHRVP
jgi:lipoate-protein ligase A